MCPGHFKNKPDSTTPAHGAANEFTTGFERIRAALGIDTQQELAGVLDIRQSSISDAKRRGVIPGEWGLKLFNKYRLNPRWVYDGLPPVFLRHQQDADETGPPVLDGSFLLKYPQDALVAVAVEDRSMEPTLLKGSFVGLDTSDTVPAPGALYGVDLPLEGVTIRRIALDPEAGAAAILADNPAIPAQRMALSDCLSRVKGRVAWVMRKA